MGNILFPSLITTVLFFVVIIILVLRAIFKKNRSSGGISYTPFDYITGQTDEEFHIQEEEENDETD